MDHKKFLIVIGGATATGKTSLAIRLANHFDTEILSCDSRQFYKEMNIGTAKPDEEELTAAKHHFIGHLSVVDNYSVGDYEKDAIALLETLLLEKNIVVLTGGSGLFIRSLCEGLDEFPDIPANIKQQIEYDFQSKGIEFLQKELEITDPVYFNKVDQKNPMRLIRALSVIRTSGKPYSYFLNKEKKPRPFIPIYINLQWDRAELYDRINRRVDLMIEKGLLEEVRSLISHKEKNALRTVGYQELFDFFDKKISLEDAIAMIKQNSRRYAKRQMTWFRRDSHWENFHPNDYEKILNLIEQRMTNASLDGN